MRFPRRFAALARRPLESRRVASPSTRVVPGKETGMQPQLFTNFVRLVPVLGLCALAALPSCSSTRQDIGSTDRPMSKTQDANAKAQGEMKLPPGWTEADMQACTIAGTPGAMHEKLQRHAGRWAGNTKMWMAPETEPMTSPCTVTISNVMDGRYSKWEMSGEMPGMGPYNGLGFNGYDNVAQKFVSTWIDNHSTGIMRGEGTLSGDTLTWTYNYMCPVNKKPTTMREILRFTGDNTMTLDMHGEDPKSGKEYHMMHIDLTRKSS
jgi:hypothetical protein